MRGGALYGQLDTLTISAGAPSPILGSNAAYRFPIDSLRRTGYASTPDLLGELPGLFVKQAAPGQLATLSYRGGSAAQTAVRWNGIPLDSPQLGLTDFSFLPLVALDHMEVQAGGNAAVDGSGAVSGTVHLGTGARISEGFGAELTSALGSFGRWDNGLRLSYGGSRWRARSRLYRRYAENDFAFRVRPGLEVRQQSHARIEQRGTVQEMRYETEAYAARLTAWYQHVDRQLPALTTQRRSTATQADRQWRISLQQSIDLAPRQRIALTSGYVRDRIDYRNPTILLVAPSGFDQLFQEGTWQYRNRARAGGATLALAAGYRFQRYRADADGYPQGVRETRQSLFARATLTRRKWTATLAARQPRIDARLLAPAPALAATYRAGGSLRLDARVAYNYRYPTLNDRFWSPGGKPDLRAERGWSQALGLRCRLGDWHYRGGLHHRLVRDWILWAPGAGGFFTASNLTRVRSYGLEQQVHKSWTVGQRTRLQLQLQHSFTRSANQLAIAVPRLAAGEQLPYVPRHQGRIALRGDHRRLFARAAATYTGSVGGLNVDLPSYWLLDGRLGYAFERPRYHGTVVLGVHNVLDTWFQVVERRPAPGRYFDLTFLLTFQQKTQ